jgi:hypothetical protein
VAVEKVSKALVAVHESSRDRFMSRLQRLGVLHVTRDESAVEAAAQARDRSLARINAAIEFLGQRADRQAKARPVLGREQFEHDAQCRGHEEVLSRLDAVNRELGVIDARVRQVEVEAARLLPWKGLRYAPDEMYGIRGAITSAVRFPDRAEFDRAEQAVAGLPTALELVGASADGAYAILV